MRVRVALDVAELGGDAGLLRLAQVEDESLPALESVGEELAVRRHLVLGVMVAVAKARDGDRRHQAAIATVVLGDVKDGEEIRLLSAFRRSPQVEIFPGRLDGRGGLAAAGCEDHQHREPPVRIASINSP